MNATKTLSFAEIQQQISALSDEDKLHIARFLENEIKEGVRDTDSAEEAPLAPWQKDELLLRRRLVEEGKETISDWDDAFERIKQRLRSCA